jgi:signal transduction histidine kinase
MQMTEEAAAPRISAGGGPRWGLSGKLLVLTILFVMIAEVLIYVPLIAYYRLTWLNEQLAKAYTVARVLDVVPSRSVDEDVVRRLLNSIGAQAVAIKMGDQRRLLAISDVPPPSDHAIDTRSASWFDAVVDAFQDLLSSSNGVVRVMGPAPMGGEFFEIVLDQESLRKALVQFSTNILVVSLIISGITLALLYFALNYLFVRPMRRITANMEAFRADPEDPSRIISISGRKDELGMAERDLALMQRDLASMLLEKSRLAALGLAVAKISHDLRNLLGAAQLFSDQLSNSPDPRVQRSAPKLIRTIERAVALCQSTLTFGGAQEPPPDRRPVLLASLVEEVHAGLGLAPGKSIKWITEVENGLMVDADPDQLFRILLNLARNAVQAIDGRAASDPPSQDQARLPDQVRITGRREGTVVVIEVADTGPGVSERARAHLFEAFQGGTRGGAGLGLAITAELVRAHGGEIRLVNGTVGAIFHISIPDRVFGPKAPRGEPVGA